MAQAQLFADDYKVNLDVFEGPLDLLLYLIRRGRRYDAIILDPPSFGRGAGGEMYKIERDLRETLSLVKELLSERPVFVLFSSHTPGLSPIVAENILSQLLPGTRVEKGEMLLEGSSVPCPSGIYCRAVFNLPFMV